MAKKEKRSVGHPIEYTEEILSKIETALLSYIKQTEIPILAEFAYKNDIRRAALYEHDELTYAREKCLAKKEAQLEAMGLKGDVNPSMAIFSLKQLGWRDRKEIDAKIVTDLDSMSEEDINKELEELSELDDKS